MVFWVLMGTGVFMSTVRFVLVRHQWCILLGREWQVMEVCLAKAVHSKASWDIACGCVQMPEVVAKGSRFIVMEHWLIHYCWVI